MDLSSFEALEIIRQDTVVDIEHTHEFTGGDDRATSIRTITLASSMSDPIMLAVPTFEGSSVMARAGSDDCASEVIRRGSKDYEQLKELLSSDLESRGASGEHLKEHLSRAEEFHRLEFATDQRSFRLITTTSVREEEKGWAYHEVSPLEFTSLAKDREFSLTVLLPNGRGVPGDKDYAVSVKDYTSGSNIEVFGLGDNPAVGSRICISWWDRKDPDHHVIYDTLDRVIG